MSAGKIILGVLAGAAAGALLGVLIAPEKGDVTRKKISKKGKEYSNAVKENLDGIMDSLNQKFEQVKGDLNDLAHKVVVKKDEIIKDVKSV